MTPPLIYPEGLAIPYARPPQDMDTFLQDQTRILTPSERIPDPPGNLSPLYVESTPPNYDEPDSEHLIDTGPAPQED